MSNTFLNKSEDIHKKVIKVRPIELLNKNKKRNLVPLDKKNALIQDEIKRAEEKLQSLERQKETLLKKAQSDIKQEKDNWKSEKKVLIEKAKEEGYNSGFHSGKQEGLKQYEGLLEEANSITKAATNDYHSMIDQSDDTIVKLAIHTAEKVIKQKLSEQPEALLNIVKGAIKELTDQSVISIHLHPDNYPFVLQQKEELINTLDGEIKISVYIDQEMPENSCIIEHPFGQIDASVDTQLQQIRDVLQEVVWENKQ